MKKKRGKNTEKKDLFRIIGRLALILLLPLLLELMHMGYEQIIIPFLSPISIKEQQIFRIVIFGTSISLIIAYGYITKDKITSILSGVFLIPLFFLYHNILWALAHHCLTIKWLIAVLGLPIPFMLINGLAGYFASRGTKVSLLIAILFAVLFIFIVLGID
jgi:nitrous oxidase accessory protein